MLKKIMLIALFSTAMTQANFDLWKVNTGSKIAHTVFAVAGVSAGSYAIYKVVCLAIDKLENDKKISSRTASGIKIFLKVKFPVLPLQLLYYHFMYPTEMIETSRIFKTFLGYFSHGARLVGPEYTVLTEALKFFSPKF